jgi:hypothetical protein
MLTEKDISAVVARVVAVVATKEDFAKLGKRIDGLDTRISGVELGLIHVQGQLAETNERIAGLDEKLDRHLILLDKLVGKVDTMILEYSAVSVQLSRHEEWIKKLAEKAGVALEY